MEKSDSMRKKKKRGGGEKKVTDAERCKGEGEVTVLE